MKAVFSISLFLLITGSPFANTLPDTGRHTSNFYLQKFDQQPALPPVNRLSLPNIFLKVELLMGYAQTTATAGPHGMGQGKTSMGGGLGIVLSGGITGMFSIGAYYQTSGLRLKDSELNGDTKDNNIRLQYLKIPLQYQFYVGKGKKVFLGGGAFGAAMLVPAVQKVQVFNENDMRKLDAGLIASAGIRLTRRWMVQANAEWGIVDIDQATGPNLEKNNRYFLGISYVIPVIRL